MKAAPTLRLALPWLHRAIVEARTSRSLPALDSLSWLVGRGTSAPAPDDDWREWLLGVDAHALAEFRRWPAGPCLAAATGAGPDSAPAWGVAQPVHLVAGMDHVRLGPLADALPADAEAEQLADTVRAHFAGDVLDLAGYRDHAWLVRCVEAVECTTHDPASVAGLDIHDYLPAGPDGARMRSRMNEIQMVLHEHPVNERRANTRAAAINALWLWGFGRLEAVPAKLAAAARWTLLTDDLWLRAFWQVHGGAERPLGDSGTPHGDTLVAMTQPPTAEHAEALTEVDSSLLARLCRSLQDGELHELKLHDGARVHTLDRRSRWRLWRRAARPADL
jgi:hypothetical protein